MSESEPLDTDVHGYLGSCDAPEGRLRLCRKLTGIARIHLEDVSRAGDRQYVRSVAYDCDADCILVRAVQTGRGACHTGERSCFFREFGDGQEPGRR